MKHLFDRFTSPTPAFWRKVQKAAAGGLAVVVALQAGTSGPPWLANALPTGLHGADYRRDAGSIHLLGFSGR